MRLLSFLDQGMAGIEGIGVLRNPIAAQDR